MRKKIAKIITSDEVLGKEAVDADGSIIGVVTKIHINKETMKIVGISVDMGFMKPELFVGSNYIKHFGIDAVLLKKVPVDKYMGLRVITFEGKLIGKVKNIIMKRRKIKEFEISSTRIFGKGFVIKYSDIKEIGDQIILKEKYKIIKWYYYL